MLIYNTLTKKKEEFIPKNSPNVTMYVCGPTIYDYFHIGNARSFVMSDIVRRYLEYKNFDVKFVMNLTDVDDKLIKKANEENVPVEQVAEKYADAFFEDIEKLGIKKATVYPKATEHMQDIVDLIKNLVDTDYAYNVDGNVFYNVNKFKGYGKLSGKNIDDLESGARIEINEEKKNPLDFSLWKKAKPNEPAWESPWGKGRPGWHIECSAMSMKHLGETIDIHAGGNDLIFPHHENEIAQSEACCTNEFVKYWIHFGFLNLNQEKMSKSLGNFFTAREILKEHSANSIRYLFSQTHYSGPLNFSKELLESSEKGLEKIYNLVQRIENIKPSMADNLNTFENERYLFAFESAMDDNFNTPQALASIYDFIRDFNKFLNKNDQVAKNDIIKAKDFLTKTLTDVLGIVLFSTEEKGESKEDDLIKLLIEIRQKAKLDKNYSLADEIRNKLSELGITLADSKEGTTYKISK
ncbi:MAG: cysteine--tRNA ligase [Ignavibacteriales bacterium]|nr:cysteine--tRNA ligase [Ignavibacteriales bacterium]MCB9217957.1 cysteine--tRNA ligase [Ignavibacteriales bacterium]MCB9260346.1 cysteine--tRNA ligase [Ignavibacteriales bacterium]